MDDIAKKTIKSILLYYSTNIKENISCQSLSNEKFIRNNVIVKFCKSKKEIKNLLKWRFLTFRL